MRKNTNLNIINHHHALMDCRAQIFLTPDEIEGIVRLVLKNRHFSSDPKRNQEIIDCFKKWFPGQAIEYDNLQLIINNKTISCDKMTNIEVMMEIVFRIGFPGETFTRNACGEWEHTTIQNIYHLPPESGL
jgi:hypothetical protein